jgi:Family of unknown function (DUF5681)
MGTGMSDPDERIGYKLPPKHSRFKIGNREHLKRRKKLKNDFTRTAQNFLEEKISYRDGHKQKRAHRIDVLLKKIGSAALKGDLGAAAALMDLRENPKLTTLKKSILYLTKNETLY